ncbi:MAG TPA: hypothetical protein VFL13_01515 [Candidatus Baltobacteraceae bacterium]|nr:hypothetical protein [Candidatus Baltobacteraceae bacterium]
MRYLLDMFKLWSGLSYNEMDCATAQFHIVARPKGSDFTRDLPID